MANLSNTNQELRIPLHGLPPDPVVYLLRKALFQAAGAARTTVNKDIAKAFEEAGRGIKVCTPERKPT